MRSSTKSESNENNGNGSPCDNINNNSNDGEKPATTPMSENAIAEVNVIATTTSKSPTSAAHNKANEGVIEDVIDISSSHPECNSKFINQPVTTENDSTIQKAEPVDNSSEKKVNVYEQVSMECSWEWEIEVEP